MSSPVNADFAQDIKNQLSNILQDSGYTVAENHPQSIAGFTDEQLKYRIAWNIAFQFFNIRKRSIEPRSRIAVLSQELGRRTLSAAHKASIDLIVSESQTGASLTHFMTTSMQDAAYDDTLLNDWGIVHFHLGSPTPDKPSLITKLATFVSRSGPLLFVFPTYSHLYLIDVLAHGSWAERDMIEILHCNWPNILSPYRLPGVTSGIVMPDEETIKALRKAGVSYPLMVSDGTVYMSPGGGYSSDRSSAYAVDKANQLFNTIRRLDELIRAQADSLIRRINAQFGTTIDNLNLSLHYDGQQFNVIETQTRTGLWQGKI